MKKVIEFAKRVYGDHVEFNDAQTQRLQEIEALVRADERERIEHAAIGSVKAAILYEREACAKVCDDWAKTSYLSEAKSCARIIRARGNT